MTMVFTLLGIRQGFLIPSRTAGKSLATKAHEIISLLVTLCRNSIAAGVSIFVSTCSYSLLSSDDN